MATLIICPACGTRYQIKAAFPPEGRKVRCAKCSHVWQAQPAEAAMPQAAAQSVFKLIRSAVANAEENLGLARDDLYIVEIYADAGPTRRWRRFGARGRFKPLLKRSSHITVILAEYEVES